MPIRCPPPLQLVEYLTKFATVFLAITGDAFFTAGRKVTDLLVRNLLNTFASTVWFTPLVIQASPPAAACLPACLPARLPSCLAQPSACAPSPFPAAVFPLHGRSCVCKWA